jgi:hypothetical protein
MEITFQDGDRIMTVIANGVKPHNVMRALRVMEAAKQLTFLGITKDGAVAIGPQGWENLQDAINGE